MSYEVVVVGGGIGGLTVAALLAKRGMSVCLLEREAHAGGCALNVEKFGYSFEPGAGIYHGFGSEEIHQRIFAELGMEPPEARPNEPSYLVRLPDHSQIIVTSRTEEFEANLRAAFPECPDAAISFYRDTIRTGQGVISTVNRLGYLPDAGKIDLLRAALPDPSKVHQLWKLRGETVEARLANSSDRFRRFIDLQLQSLSQCASDECSYLFGSVALTIASQRLYTIAGGPSALIEKLEESFRSSGGKLRLNAPVLRLAYRADGHAVGVDLLSGEQVMASRAIVSNLTVWDTYGKLVGLERTPPNVRNRLKALRSRGAYLIYLGMDEEAADRLESDRLFVLTAWQTGQRYDAESAQFSFTITPQWDTRAPQGKRAVTVCTVSEPEDWFAYHEDQSEHEEQDQGKLEFWWSKIHESLPELGSAVEIIDTATPRSFYELTRRKLGYVAGISQSPSNSGLNAIGYRTSLPNLYLVGDTTFPGAGVAAVSYAASLLADEISR